jgi:hypothetical protein
VVLRDHGGVARALQSAAAAARAAFRNDAAVRAELDRFRRVTRRAKRQPAEEAV